MSNNDIDIDNDIYDFIENHKVNDSNVFEDDVAEYYGDEEPVYYQQQDILPNRYDPRRNNQPGWKTSAVEQDISVKKAYRKNKQQSNIGWSCLGIALCLLCIGYIVVSVIATSGAPIP